MEGIVVLLILFALWVLVAPIVAMVKAGDAGREAREIRDQLQDALKRLKALEAELRQTKRVPDTTAGSDRKTTAPPWKPSSHGWKKKSAGSRPPRKFKCHLPCPCGRKLVDWEKPEVPPELPEAVEPQEPFSLEKFMGVKLFAWLGGVAMFFGVIFFVKYAFENNLISPALRITLGFVTGSGLLIGGLLTHRLRTLPGAGAGVLRHRRADPLRREFRRACDLSFPGVRHADDLRPDGG